MHNASEKQLKLSLQGEEMQGYEHPSKSLIMEEIAEGRNLLSALRRVKQNGGSAGIDEMSVTELPQYVQKHWQEIVSQLIDGTYKPQPVRRVEIPKPDGRKRKLGIPTVMDRFIQQAVAQILSEHWDSSFSESSFGFRPKRKAHKAVEAAQKYVKAGYRYVVDIDLEKFFDRVNHNKLMHLLRKRIKDERLLVLIKRFLKSGVMEGGLVSQTVEGTPQGGNLSPLLSNLMLDELDKELEKRRHKFVRYADDCNIYIKTKRAGQRVMKSVSEFITYKLKLKVNAAKSAVDRPWNRKFLGFSFTNRKDAKRKVAPEVIKRFKDKIRVLTKRTRGISLRQMIQELAVYVKGWNNYFGIAEVTQEFKYLNSWIRRRLRCMLWKQWGSAGYRRLRSLGVSVELAWNTSKSAHGPWRLSHSPALQIALGFEYFQKLGLIELGNIKL